jgi:hypothetical protein
MCFEFRGSQLVFKDVSLSSPSAEGGCWPFTILFKSDPSFKWTTLVRRICIEAKSAYKFRDARPHVSALPPLAGRMCPSDLTLGYVHENLPTTPDFLKIE